MKSLATTSICLDKRRVKANGKFPAKLRVFTMHPRKQKLYSLPYDFTETEFKSILETTKPRSEHKLIRAELNSIQSEAVKVISNMEIFAFDQFETKMFGAKMVRSKNDVIGYYEQAIKEYHRNRQISTASNYELSLKSLMDFHNRSQLHFTDITKQWLNDYEAYITIKRGLSQTTVGFYLRPLRAIFNKALADNVIQPEHYPFGKKKYVIPAPKAVKKAFDKNKILVLWKALPTTIEQQRAKDFWFFSYDCAGMNFKDILLLKWKNISDGMITFNRAKVMNTNREQRSIRIPIDRFVKVIIEKYGNVDQSPESLVFPILNTKASPTEQKRQKDNFIRFVNQHFKKFAKANGITENVSTYWARHSFVTIGITEYEIPISFFQEVLGHSKQDVINNYIGGYPEKELVRYFELIRQR